MDSKILIEMLQATPWFREPSAGEIDGACLHQCSDFNFLNEAQRQERRDQARKWLRAWKAETNLKWLEADPLPEWKPREKRRKYRDAR